VIETGLVWVDACVVEGIRGLTAVTNRSGPVAADSGCLVGSECPGLRPFSVCEGAGDSVPIVEMLIDADYRSSSIDDWPIVSVCAFDGPGSGCMLGTDGPGLAVACWPAPLSVECFCLPD
jgi:hypothetical protein